MSTKVLMLNVNNVVNASTVQLVPYGECCRTLLESSLDSSQTDYTLGCFRRLRRYQGRVRLGILIIDYAQEGAPLASLKLNKDKRK